LSDVFISASIERRSASARPITAVPAVSSNSRVVISVAAAETTGQCETNRARPPA